MLCLNTIWSLFAKCNLMNLIFYFYNLTLSDLFMHFKLDEKRSDEKDTYPPTRKKRTLFDYQAPTLFIFAWVFPISRQKTKFAFGKSSNLLLRFSSIVKHVCCWSRGAVMTLPNYDVARGDKKKGFKKSCPDGTCRHTVVGKYSAKPP